MSEEIVEMFRKVFDDHFCRETAISLGFEYAYVQGLITEKEYFDFIVWLNAHPHKVLGFKRMKEAGLTCQDVAQADLDNVIEMKKQLDNDAPKDGPKKCPRDECDGECIEVEGMRDTYLRDIYDCYMVDAPKDGDGE